MINEMFQKIPTIQLKRKFKDKILQRVIEDIKLQASKLDQFYFRVGLIETNKNTKIQGRCKIDFQNLIILKNRQE